MNALIGPLTGKYVEARVEKDEVEKKEKNIGFSGHSDCLKKKRWLDQHQSFRKETHTD